MKKSALLCIVLVAACLFSSCTMEKSYSDSFSIPIESDSPHTVSMYGSDVSVCSLTLENPRITFFHITDNTEHSVQLEHAVQWGSFLYDGTWLGVDYSGFMMLNTSKPENQIDQSPQYQEYVDEFYVAVYQDGISNVSSSSISLAKSGILLPSTEPYSITHVEKMNQDSYLLLLQAKDDSVLLYVTADDVRQIQTPQRLVGFCYVESILTTIDEQALVQYSIPPLFQYKNDLSEYPVQGCFALPYSTKDIDTIDNQHYYAISNQIQEVEDSIELHQEDTKKSLRLTIFPSYQNSTLFRNNEHIYRSQIEDKTLTVSKVNP